MLTNTFGKPKKQILSLIFVLIFMIVFIVPQSTLIFPENSTKYGLWFSIIVFGVIAISLLIRYLMYKQEIDAFKQHKKIDRQHHVFFGKKVLGLDRSTLKRSKLKFHKLIKKHRMLWDEKDNSIICFTNIFSDIAIKLTIISISKENHQIDLKFIFHDRFLQPKMTNWVQKKYKAEMERIFESFKALIEK